jgi:hypothetical protein
VQEISFSYVSVEITVRNKVPSRNILAATLFLEVVSRYLEEPISQIKWFRQVPLDITIRNKYLKE